MSSGKFFLFFTPLFFASNFSFAKESQNYNAYDILLAPILIKKSASDILNTDLFSKANSNQLSDVSSHADGYRVLENETSTAVSKYSGDGAEVTQIRGLGRSAQEINVQTLGVPLNPPQGGGFDFQTLPSFLWSSAEYFSFKNSGAFDANTIAGAFVLEPWTVKAIESNVSQSVIEHRFSSPRSREYIFRLDRTNQFATVMGVQDGDTRGFSGVSSFRLIDKNLYSAKIHFIFTSLHSDPKGSSVFKTPNAHKYNFRGIPVLEWDYYFSKYSYLKSSLFYDRGFIQYDDPDYNTHTKDHSHQLGTENVWVQKNFRLGFSFKEIKLQTNNFTAPTEDVLFINPVILLQASESIVLEPSVQWIQTNTQGYHPGAGLNSKFILSDVMSVDLQLLYSSRLPSLTDRYYEDSFFIPNPKLKPERTYTHQLGAGFKLTDFDFNLLYRFQFRKNLILMDSISPGSWVTTSENRGSGRIYALEQKLKWKIKTGFSFTQESTFTDSKVHFTGLEYPYLPRLTEKLGVVYESFRLNGRIVSSALANSSGDRVSGYGYLDVGYRGVLFKWPKLGEDSGFTLDFSVENILDRRYETIQYFPSAGRTYHLSLSAQF